MFDKKHEADLRKEVSNAITVPGIPQELHDVVVKMVMLIIERECIEAENHGHGRGMIASLDAIEASVGGSEGLTKLKQQINEDMHHVHR